LLGLQANLSSATGNAAAGNVSMGNVSMDQMQLAPNRTSAFMNSWQDNATGNTISSNVLNGRTSVSLLRNQGFASRVVSMRVSEQDVTEANKQVDAARGEAVSANTERSAVLTDAFTRGLAKYQSSRSSGGSSSSSFEQIGENLNRMDQITKGVAEKTGLSQSQVAQIAFGASGYFGVGTPGASPIKAGLQANASAGKSYSSGLTADQQKALNTLTSDQIAEFKQFGDRVSRDSSFMDVVGADAKDAKDMSSRLGTATSRSERADATLAERTAFAQRMSAANERGESISIDLAQDPHNVEMFMRYSEQYGGNSAAAFAMFDAELARQGLRPNRVFSDGTALPASFDDILTRHAQDTANPHLNPDMEKIDHEHREQVSHVNTAVPKRTQQIAHTGGIRSEIRVQGAEIRKQADSASEGFDGKAEIVKTSDGTLASRKSLLKQTGKQVVDDAGATLDNTRDIVKDIFNKKK